MVLKRHDDQKLFISFRYPSGNGNLPYTDCQISPFDAAIRSFHHDNLLTERGRLAEARCWPGRNFGRYQLHN